MTSTENQSDESVPRAPDPGTHASSELTSPQPSEPNAPAPAEAAHASSESHPSNGEPGAAGDDGDEHEDGEGEPAQAGEGAPNADASGGPAGPGGVKKKRRRRRKKKSGEGQSADAAPGGAAPNGEAGEAGEAGAEGAKRPERPKHRDRQRDSRERPAFNVGDVVFGKIIEINDDALVIDAAGKARAIFDRREMDLPDDVEYGADPEELDEEPVAEAAPGEASAEGTPAAPEASAEAATATDTAAVAAPETAATEAATPAETPADATTETAAASSADGTGDAPAELAPVEPHAPNRGREAPELPPFTMELGANFVGVVHNDGGRGGLVVLTRHPKRVQRAKLVVAGAFKERGEVLGLVTGIIRGGVEVDVDGLRAFAPGSHMDMRLGADLHHLVGKRMLFVVTQYAKRGRDVVLSRRPFLEDEAKLLREAALSMLEIGSVVEGTVRSVVQFGAFVDVGGIEGLVPLSEMSHNRGDGPHDVFKVGEKTTVKIVKVDERGKVWLSRRSAIPDPWLEVAKKYPVGAKLTGKVARLQPFGAFIELEPGIDGLIHTADLSMKRIDHPNEVIKEGDSLEVMVVHLEVGNHRIGLHPAPTGDAANEAPQRVILHKPVKVAVVAYESSGLIVRILGATGRHARGYISAAATGTPRGTELRRVYALNQVLDAKVMEMDPRNNEVKLSIRALSEDTERTAYRQYREQVQRESKFGTFGDLLKKNLQK